jgi:hypothetical protein
MRRGLVLVVALALCLPGCTSLVERSKNPFHFVLLYLSDRAQDAMEVADVGVTVTPQPNGAFYMSFASITPVGAAHVDGRFIGLGGGQLFGLGAGEWGSTRFYLSAGGALAWGYEELGWKEFDTKNMSTLQCQDVGLAGVFLPPYGRPGPVPS